MKNRLRNYALWTAVAALILIILQAFGIHIVETQYDSIVNAILSVLVLAGIINNPSTDNRGFGDDNNK